ncbi:Glycosyltransferase involved in cell wall bisynthesis [Aquimarina amphilecti]|uniref:Glycosyltransferase involved in cell wall bisynthesis n=1 Tax=Aquimarina amphilecti TaxID=1038014 RepID=A0A1H7UA76_AQUAM|nr:glycosyltransferase family 4 protein [Aquimarina amphilecti]SEL93646.1 Glycosyltransferase involved in cell wall bisynthesis [Aquimarina amphilecti]
MNNLLIIGKVWPEPNSSAAGSRMLQLIKLFISKGFEITFASTAAESDHMHNIEILGVKKISITINNNSFDDFINNLRPEIVMFDRFMSEEQFGWRVTKHCPQAVRILNTEDLHSLRKTRKEAFKKGIDFKFSDLKSSDITKREIASIYRSDLSLIISDAEINILQKHFNIKKELLHHLPFLLDPITSEIKNNWDSYDQRNHFVTIGNFRHEPNWNSVLYLKETIWPLIKKQLPETELHIYGAYPPPKATQLHSPSQGFYIKGWTEDAELVMKKARVCLAPLRFGAGIKGKLSEAMLCGTPSVTTTIGAEGMLDEDSDWNGFIKDSPEEFANAAVRLHNTKNIWYQAQQNGIEIINTKFKKEELGDQFIKQVVALKNNLKEHRTKNFIGSMLQYHTMRSTEFMSRWIEEKNKQD